MGEPGDRPLRVAIADDQELSREGLAQLLSQRGVDVVAQTGDADELVAKVAGREPDVVVTDQRLRIRRESNGDRSDGDGLRTAIELRAEHPELGVLVMAERVHEDDARQLIGADSRGAGYLRKSRAGDITLLTEVLARIAAGGSALEPELVAQLLEGPRGRQLTGSFGERQRATFALVLEGRSDRDIGRALRLRAGAVKRQLAALRLALGLEAELDEGARVGSLLALLADQSPSNVGAAERSDDLAPSWLDYEQVGGPRGVAAGLDRA